MKDTYRERIKEEQKKLSPQQFFFQKAISGFSSILQMKWQGKSWSSCFCTRTLQMGLPAGMTERGLASTLIMQMDSWNWMVSGRYLTEWRQHNGRNCNKTFDGI